MRTIKFFTSKLIYRTGAVIVKLLTCNTLYKTIKSGLYALQMKFSGLSVNPEKLLSSEKPLI